ncbi:MAG: MOSC domain-containing protein [Acidobacteriia bacterium]|nr:MOSC domain-containing protein [Terriglobia bacterium]
MAITVSSIFYHPVKSVKSKPLTRAEIGVRGIPYDREWMVVDERGMFVAQRQSSDAGVEVRTMCLVDAAMRDGHLVLTAPGLSSISVPLDGPDTPEDEVQVWEHHARGVDQGEEVSRWLSELLGRERPGKYRLMRMSSQHVRRAKMGDSQLAFADGYPFLIISQASLDDLNRRLSEALPMNRFRPNIVLEGCSPYQEDQMALIRVGNVLLEGQGLCARCPTTATNQETAERGKEPLRTLATYRRHPGGADGVVFGRNFNHLNLGTISIGDSVEILATD